MTLLHNIRLFLTSVEFYNSSIKEHAKRKQDMCDLTGRPEGKGLLQSSRRRRNDGIKKDLADHGSRVV